MHLRVFRNAVRIDTHGAVADSSNVSLHVDAAARGNFVAAHADARGREVAGVGVCLEADEVCAEHPIENLLSARETPEDLGTRERRVDEEADGGVWERLTEQRRDEEKVVVVDPDQVTGPVHFCHAAREGSVDGSIGRPVGVGGRVLCCDILPEQVVEERPEGCRTRRSASWRTKGWSDSHQ